MKTWLGPILSNSVNRGGRLSITSSGRINIQSKKNLSKITICREMREEFDKYGLLITAAVAAPIRLVDQVHYF